MAAVLPILESKVPGFRLLWRLLVGTNTEENGKKAKKHVHGGSTNQVTEIFDDYDQEDVVRIPRQKSLKVRQG